MPNLLHKLSVFMGIRRPQKVLMVTDSEFNRMEQNIIEQRRMNLTKRHFLPKNNCQISFTQPSRMEEHKRVSSGKFRIKITIKNKEKFAEFNLIIKKKY